MPNHDLVNRDLAFLNEYRTSIGIKLLLLHVLCYTTNDPSAQRKQFFADSKDALKLYRAFRNEKLQPMLNIYFGDMPSAIYNRRGWCHPEIGRFRPPERRWPSDQP